MNAARTTDPTHRPGQAPATTGLPTGDGARAVVAVEVVTLHAAFAAPAARQPAPTGPYGPAA
ncbi:hypothetical protein ACFCWY_09525 [Streptomyces sp. NPDC056362]|uniref:hypothetical protein n=1 Tax=unclassified Streptomyces TaxID=2593676 RepID=UPI0035DCA15C